MALSSQMRQLIGKPPDFRYFPLMNRLALFIGMIWTIGTLSAQSTYQPLGSNAYHFLDRLEIKTGKMIPTLHTTTKPYTRRALTQYANTFDTADVKITGIDRYNVYSIYKENSEWAHREPLEAEQPILKYFYRNRADFYHYTSERFMTRINPLIYWAYGREIGEPTHKYVNTRGVQVRGWINKKVGFYSSLAETQTFYPEYVKQRVKKYQAVPGHGFYKDFGGTLAHPDSGETGYDYIDAQGHITFRATQDIGFQFGHGKNFIGNGHRSLFLSDYSDNYLFLKVNTKLWRFQYQNIFMKLTGQYTPGPDRLYPQKYAAVHHMSFNIADWWNIGFFESIMYDRSRGLELGYLNPVIFYRSIEQQLGSPDNAMMGVDFKLNFARHFSFYGQYLIDDFNLNHLRDIPGWWGQRQGYQVGLKYIDVAGIDNLDLQVEFNTIRPYTYAYRDSIRDYSHYNQPLAHPLGANFTEVIGKIHYQPFPKWFVNAKVLSAVKGADTTGGNWGGNIFKPYTTRQNETGNHIGQGYNKNIQLLDLTLSYQWRHNLYFDLRYLYRNVIGEFDRWNDQTHFIRLGVRLNMPQQQMDF